MLRCAHLLARWLTHSLSSSWEKNFIQFQPTVHRRRLVHHPALQCQRCQRQDSPHLNPRHHHRIPRQDRLHLLPHPCHPRPHPRHQGFHQ